MNKLKTEIKTINLIQEELINLSAIISLYNREEETKFKELKKAFYGFMESYFNSGVRFKK